MTIKTHLIKTVAAFLVMLALSCAAAMPALADSSQQLQGEAYALYDASQHSLTFKRGDVPACSSGQQVFTGFENESYSLNTTPWAKVARTIGTVSFEDTVRPKSTAYWFTGFRNAVSFDLAKLDTSQVTDMSAMFKTCVRLNSVDVTSFDTSKVTNMESMFDGCTNLGYLDVTAWDTSNVTTMYAMFLACKNLTYLDMSHWDTSKVTNMAVMFSDADNLVAINLTGVDTSSVESMHLMFFGCYQLTDLDLSSFSSKSIFSQEQTGSSGEYSFFGYSLSEREGWARKLQRITMNGSYTTYADFTFPSQTSDMVQDADGLWYDEQGNSYSGQVPSQAARTYYASPTMASKIDISAAQLVIDAGTLQADGTEQRPAVSVTCNGKTLQEGVDYDVEYFNNSYAGIATAAVYGKGAWRGVALKHFALGGTERPASDDYDAAADNEPQTPKTVTVSGIRYLVDASAKTVTITGLASKGKKASTITIPSTITVSGTQVKVIGISAKALKGSKAQKLVVTSKNLSKSSVKGSLKGSKIKVVKIKVSGSAAAKKVYLAKCKKWFSASNCGRRVSVS